MQGLTNLRGKSFTFATKDLIYDLRTNVPSLFTGIPDQADRYDAIYLILIRSDKNFQISLQNDYDSVWTDYDLINAGTLRSFQINEVSVKNIRLIPSADNQTLYVYLASI